jgi:hypothetical protein
VRGGEHLPAREPMQGVPGGEHLPAPAREELMQGVRGGEHLPAMGLRRAAPSVNTLRPFDNQHRVHPVYAIPWFESKATRMSSNTRYSTSRTGDEKGWYVGSTNRK